MLMLRYQNNAEKYKSNATVMLKCIEVWLGSIGCVDCRIPPKIDSKSSCSFGIKIVYNLFRFHKGNKKIKLFP